MCPSFCCHDSDPIFCHSPTLFPCHLVHLRATYKVRITIYVTILICTALTKGLPSASLLSVLFLASMLIGLSFICSAFWFNCCFNLRYTISWIVWFYFFALYYTMCSLCNFSISTLLSSCCFKTNTLRASSCSFVFVLFSSSNCTSYLLCYIQELIR